MALIGQSWTVTIPIVSLGLLVLSCYLQLYGISLLILWLIKQNGKIFQKFSVIPIKEDEEQVFSVSHMRKESVSQDPNGRKEDVEVDMEVQGDIEMEYGVVLAIKSRTISEIARGRKY